MGFVEKAEAVMIGLVMLLIISTFLGSIDSTLTTELQNTETHPNGLLTLTLVALIIVAFAMAILLTVFKDRPPGGEQPFPTRRFGGDLGQ